MIVPDHFTETNLESDMSKLQHHNLDELVITHFVCAKGGLKRFLKQNFQESRHYSKMLLQQGTMLDL
jgi:hypothetical protein